MASGKGQQMSPELEFAQLEIEAKANAKKHVANILQVSSFNFLFLFFPLGFCTVKALRLEYMHVSPRERVVNFKIYWIFRSLSKYLQRCAD